MSAPPPPAPGTRAYLGEPGARTRTRPGSGWYVVNRAAAAAEVTVYGDIGAGGVLAATMLADIGSAREVDLRINSGGGDAFEALTIYNRLKGLRRVSVTVDGLAASAASVIAMAASPGQLAMAQHSRMMVHEAWMGGPGGNAAELAAMSAVLDGLSDDIAQVYARRAGRGAAYWRGQMRTETWYSAAEAVSAGLADYVVPSDPVAAFLRVHVNAALRRRPVW